MFTKKMNFYSILVLIFSLLFVLSCEDNQGTVPSGDGDTEDGTGVCVQDIDCPDGYVCNNTTQTCSNLPSCDPNQSECTADHDCDFGFHCQELGSKCTCEKNSQKPDGDGDEIDVDKTDGDTPPCDCSNAPCIGLSPDALMDFGAVLMGSKHQKSLVITNNGNQTLKVLSVQFSADTSKDFSWSGGKTIDETLVLAPEESFTLDVEVQATDPGKDTGIIEIVSNDECRPKVSLPIATQYKGRTVINVSPTEHDYGPVEVGGEPSTIQVTIKNNVGLDEDSNKVLSIYGIRLNPPETKQTDFFLQDDLPEVILLNPGDAFQFPVFFQPHGEAKYGVDLILNHNADQNPYSPDDSSAPVTIPLSGEGVMPCLEVDPNPVEFNDVTIGYTARRQISLTSDCGGAVRMCGIEWKGGSEPDWLKIYDNGNIANSVIAPKSFTTFDVTCEPDGQGLKSGVIEICSNDADQSITQLIVNCSGVKSRVEIDPDPLDFGKTLLNSTKTETFKFYNNGSGPIAIESWDVKIGKTVFTEVGSTNHSGKFTINGGEEAEFFVKYKPTIQEAGRQDLGTVEIVTDNASNPTYTVQLKGTPVWPECDFSLVGDPNFTDTVEFGEVPLNQSKSLQLRITNNGSDTCIVHSIQLGSNSDDTFSFYPWTLPKIDNTPEDIVITFNPRGEAGLEKGTIIITTNDIRPDHDYVQFNLEGRGIDPTIDITPDTKESNRHDFGSIFKSGCSDETEFTIQNIGSGTLRIKPNGFRKVTVEDSWIMSEWNNSGDLPKEDEYYQLRNHKKFPNDKVTFTWKFCPLGWELPQKADFEILTNDIASDKAMIYMKGEGTGCLDGYYDLDNDPTTGDEPSPGCEYFCNRPEPGNQVSYEVCDGYDNDCDGQTDEDFPVVLSCKHLIGEPGHATCMAKTECTGIGACGEGVWECQGLDVDRFEPICSTMKNIPTKETYCDWVDDDCDGKTDEDWNVGHPCLGTGVCFSGQMRCTCKQEDMGSGNCDPTSPVGQDLFLPVCDALDQAEDEDPCDGKDNDCNGTTDDGYYYIEELWDGTPGIYQCTPENPCAGDSCSASGECTIGYYECKPKSQRPNQDMVSCVPGGGSHTEICDGKDNDCDGLTDEGFIKPDPDSGQGPPCADPGAGLGCPCNGVGACKSESGHIECDRTDDTHTLTQCSTSFGGTDWDSNQYNKELCNLIDDNCNGSTDEGYGVRDPGDPSVQPVPCDGIGECGIGVLECDLPGDGTKTRCSTNPGGSNPQASKEKCDGKDNDCDEGTDEDYDVGDYCDGVGQCGNGVIKCQNEDTACCSTDLGCSNPEAKMEDCDGLDNDCDGATDEDPFNVGEPCNGVGACADKVGVYVCDGLSASRCTANDFGSTEICDEIDNDCDGETDEDFASGVCDGEGECGMGTYECVEEGHPKYGMLDVDCSTNPGGSEYVFVQEICNYKDDDCDGKTDLPFFDPVNGDDPANCGECGVVCKADNAKVDCKQGDCIIKECNPGYFDTDNDYDNGCECSPDSNDLDGQGNSCNRAIMTDPPKLKDLDKITAKTLKGTLHNDTDVDWYTFQVEDGAEQGPDFCDNYNITATLTNNPFGEFAFMVYQGTCSKSICVDGTDDFHWYTDFLGPAPSNYENTWGPGQCPCINPSTAEQSIPNFNHCGSELSKFGHTQQLYQKNTTYYIKVFRIGSSPTCSRYELEIRNGSDASSR